MPLFRTYGITALAAIALIIQGCATSTPPSANPLPYRSRTVSSVNGELTVTVALPTKAEAKAIYGVDLASRAIQPVWLEVRNGSPAPYWFLPSGLDPNYFSPSEAAFAFHSGLDNADRQLDEAFFKLELQNPVPAGSTRAGFVLVNLDEGFKAIDIDLMSRKDVKSFSFIVEDPDFKGDYKMVDFDTLYAADEIVHVENEEELLRALEALPCCTTNENGDEHGDPLNLVLVGETNDLLPAMVRRNWHPTEVIWSKAILRTINSYLRGENYRYAPISPLYVYGRSQDIGWQKARGSINERNHVRIWLSPIRFRGKKVFVGQISRDIGVKFTLKSPTISTHVIDPDVDEARRHLVEDMAYSQALARHGYVEGVGAAARDDPRMNLVGDPYFTDGLRVVLFFASRPYTLSDIELLDWKRPSGFFKQNE